MFPIPRLPIPLIKSIFINPIGFRNFSKRHTNFSLRTLNNLSIVPVPSCKNCSHSKLPRFPPNTNHNSLRAYGVARGSSSSDDDMGLFDKFKKKFGVGEMSTPVLKAAGHLLFIKIADEVNYAHFFHAFNMEDTFASWFSVVELHVWLVSVRLMDEGNDGGTVRNSMFEAMWKDIDIRSKKLEGALASARKHQVKELGEQFQTTIISYDEGLQSSDHVLAGALWRRFFKPLETPEEMTQEALLKQIHGIELLVAYVRANYEILHKLTRRQLILQRQLKWTPLNETILIKQ